MNDKELADKVEALGVVNHWPAVGMHKEFWAMVGENWSWSTPEEMLCDPRVVMALMEKCSMIFIENTPGIWACRADKCYGNRTREWSHDESQPRAIIEACVEALSD